MESRNGDLQVRFLNYCGEAARLEEILRRANGSERTHRREFRLKDLRKRLIPRVQSQLEAERVEPAFLEVAAVPRRKKRYDTFIH
ncbi:MAG: hypothetical protein HY458_01580 [Parcubacteria group bacterium]|nr:hypothetical protein [Parcubacteria group bacterium]